MTLYKIHEDLSTEDHLLLSAAITILKHGAWHGSIPVDVCRNVLGRLYIGDDLRASDLWEAITNLEAGNIYLAIDKIQDAMDGYN